MIDWVYGVYAKEWFHRPYAKELINIILLDYQLDRQSESAILWIT